VDVTTSCAVTGDDSHRNPGPVEAEQAPVRGNVTGTVVRVNGPIVELEGLAGVSLGDLVEVGLGRLPGEVVTIRDGAVTTQVYEYTGGLRVGDPAFSDCRPLSIRLGPGLLGGVFDGLLHPLVEAAHMLQPGSFAQESTQARQWTFEPEVTEGSLVGPGTAIGLVHESQAVDQVVLVPPGISGRLDELAAEGSYDPDAVIGRVGHAPIRLSNTWPVRQPRPYRERLDGQAPLTTGQRVLDLFFPLTKGSTGAVPGGFGTGKTILLQQIAKWCDADVIVYVGCGERGNEMSDVLDELRQLVDPRTGLGLMQRTVIIANTSNMPVLARELSIYTGITVAEFYRDMGLETVVIADSTSRWAEALRESASRIGALPAEEGYPAELPSRLAAFYERAGRILTLGGREASVTVIAAVSPPGGDKTEPVTAHTRRFVRTFWSLDRDLAAARHYPAVSWRDSFARDATGLGAWYAGQGDADWVQHRARAMAIVAEADRLQSVAELIGASALPDRERVILLSARLLHDAVLQQSAQSANDAYCASAKQAALLRLVLDIHARCVDLIARGVPASALEALDLSDAARARDEFAPTDAASIDALKSHLVRTLEEQAS
jgi:V/A-type H+-transporting ATPase subunit A